MSKVIGMDGRNPSEKKVQIKPGDLKDIACEECGCKYFRAVNAFKRISALVSPTGKEQIMPVPRRKISYGKEIKIWRRR